MNDVRKMIYGAIIGLLLALLLMFSIVYVSSCGLTLTCGQAEPKVDRTPIPTLVPVSKSESGAGEAMTEFNMCQVNAVDLVGAWAAAGAPETDSFPFTGVNGESCLGTFADIQPLFVENNLWKTGALGCTSCHNAELTDRSKGLDLSSYSSVLLGSRRVTGATSKGTDILGNGDWQKSKLYDVLMNQTLVPAGHSADAPASSLVLFAGEKAAP